MKKILLIIICVILLAGCGKSNEKRMCEELSEIEVNSYTDIDNYSELRILLEEKYDEYCNKSNSNECIFLKKYIDSTKTVVKTDDCNNYTSDSSKKLCEHNNNLAIYDKRIAVDFQSEELWAVCNGSY